MVILYFIEIHHSRHEYLWGLRGSYFFDFDRLAMILKSLEIFVLVNRHDIVEYAMKQKESR